MPLKINFVYSLFEYLINKNLINMQFFMSKKYLELLNKIP